MQNVVGVAVVEEVVDAIVAAARVAGVVTMLVRVASMRLI